MTEHLFRIARDRAGGLATMTRPRGGDWLSSDVDRVRALNVSMVVSALTNSEESELGLLGEAAAFLHVGLAYVACPIADRGLPSVSAIDDLVTKITEHLYDGGSVAVHCRMGIGRSSLIAAAVLVAEGFTPTTAWERVSDARGVAVPDTQAQREWLTEWFAAK